MILKKLKLQNIRSYTFVELDFPQGIVLLSGDIGSGKSTVLLAIEFALFGILKGDFSGSTLLRHGKQEGFVELNFEIDKKEVVIKRILKKSSSGIKQDSGFIVIDGIKFDATPVELKSKILSLLGYPDELLTKSKSMVYRYTVYTPQEMMKQILFEDKDERLNTLRRAFNIDKYKRIVENSSVVTAKLKQDKKELLGKISDLDSKRSVFSESSSKLIKLESELNEAIKLSEETAKKLNDKKSSLFHLEKEISWLVELKKKKAVLCEKLNEKTLQKNSNQKKIQELSEEIESLSRKINSMEINPITQKQDEIELQLISNRAEAKRILEEKIGLEQNLKFLIKEISDLETFIETFLNAKKETKLSETEGIFLELQKKISKKSEMEHQKEQLSKFIEDVSKKITELEFKKRETEHTAKKILEMDNCPLCLQHVSHNHKRDIQLKKMEEESTILMQLDNLYKEKDPKQKIFETINTELKYIFELEKKFEVLRVEISQLKKDLDEISIKKNKKAILDKNKEKIEGDLPKKSEILTKINNLIIEQESVLNEIHKQNLIFKDKNNMLLRLNEKKDALLTFKNTHNEIESDFLKVSNDFLVLEKEISSKKDLEKDFLKSKQELDLLIIEEKNITVKVSVFKKESEVLSEFLRSLEKEIAEKEAARKRLEKISRLQSYVETNLIDLVLSIEKHVMISIYREFNELFCSWFGLLVEDDLLSARLDENFSPVIMQNGYENELSNLSGGEKTAIALSYRLSLNKVINDMISTIKTKDIIILDEPTDGFSSEQLDKMRDVFSELDMRQIIIVSHEAKMEGFCDCVIRLQKKEHESSIV